MKIYYNVDFANKTQEEIEKWIKINYSKLVGSAIFTQNNSLTSKIVRWAENWGEKNKPEFTPSHTGSIVEFDKQILLFDMKPPRAKLTRLVDYLTTTKDNYAIVLRDFEINTDTFCSIILDKYGEKYPYISALRSVFTKRKSKYKQHCSECHARTLGLAGHRFRKDFNLECTPDELFYEMLRY